MRTLQTWGGVRRIEATLYRWPNGRPLPLGIAVLLRTLLYVVAAVGAVIVAGALPGVGVLVGMVAPIPRFMVPAAAAVLASRSRFDGRTLHVLAVDYLEFRWRARLSSAGRPVRKGQPR
jgi:hypothetical protein